MSEQKHTPGPWRMDRNNTHSGTIATVHGCKNADWADIWAPDASTADEEEQESNARLIAAAPDLLEVAQGTLRLLHLMDGQWPGTLAIDARAIREQAEAAIAKVKGGPCP